MRKSQKSHNSQTGHTGIAEVARLLGVSRATAYRHAREFGFKIFGRWRVDMAAVHHVIGGGH